MAFKHLLMNKTSIQNFALEFDQEVTLYDLNYSLKQILLALIVLNFFIGLVYRGLLFKSFLKNGGLKTPINVLICKFFLWLIYIIDFAIGSNLKLVPIAQLEEQRFVYLK